MSNELRVDATRTVTAASSKKYVFVEQKLAHSETNAILIYVITVNSTLSHQATVMYCCSIDSTRFQFRIVNFSHSLLILISIPMTVCFVFTPFFFFFHCNAHTNTQVPNEFLFSNNFPVLVHFDWVLTYKFWMLSVSFCDETNESVKFLQIVG